MGDYYWAEITGSKVKFNNRQSIQLIIRDVTARKSSERRNKVYEKALFGRSKACFITDNKLNIIRTNSYTESLLQDPNLSGKNLESLLSNDNEWLKEVKEADCRTFGEQTINISFSNNQTAVFNLFFNVRCETATLQK